MEFSNFVRCFQFVSVVNLLPEKMPSDLPQNVIKEILIYLSNQILFKFLIHNYHNQVKEVDG